MLDFAADKTHLSAIIDGLPDNLALMDSDGTIVYVNSAWEEFARANAGNAASTGPSTNYLDVCQRAVALNRDDSKDARRVLSGIHAVIDGSVEAFEHIYPCHSDSQHRWFKLRVRRIEIAAKSYILMSHVNATDQKLEEMRFQIGFENLTAGSVVIDPSGTVIMFNASAEALFGHQRREVIGQNVRMLMPQPDRDRHDSYIANYHATGQAKIIGTGRKVVGLRKDGTEFQMHLGIGPLEMPDGRYFIAAITDLSELNSAYERMEQAVREANLANAAKSRFLASMSHEIRTPLNAIIGFAEALEMGIGAESKLTRNESLNIIAKAGRQLNMLLSDILDFSKIEAEQLELNLVETDPNEVFLENLPVFNHMLGEKGISIENTERTEKTVYVDRGRLGQIFLNFISNAAKYNRSGGSVCFGSMETEDGEVRFYVRDTGIGISPEKEALLFKPFVRGYAGEKDIPGAGLGLAICKRLAEGMGGSIGFETVPGEGSTFWVQFPIHACTELNSKTA